jgi:transketolase C-terminal domain/subunit
MREIFGKTVTRLAEKDENIFLIAGDLGFGVVEKFVEKFPTR